MTQSSNEEERAAGEPGGASARPSEPLLPPAARGYVSRYCEQAKTILLTPREFFAAMPTSGGYRAPGEFVCVAAAVSAVMHGIISFNPLALITSFPASLLAVALGAGVAWFLAQAMGGKGTYEATFRVFAYTGATFLFQWIPVIGFLAVVYSWVLMYMGLKQVHDISDLKTLAVVILSGFLTSVIIGITMLAIWLKSIFHF